MQYRIVENPRKRALEYKDGEPISQAFVFFNKYGHDKAVEWCKKHETEYHEITGEAVSLIVTTYSKKSADEVFEALGNLDPSFLTTLSSEWVDIIEWFMAR